MNEAFNNIPKGWESVFESQRDTLYRIDLILKEDGCKEITPPLEDVFRIYKTILPENIKVIIIGQDPYPERGVANGISFSTHPYNPVPRSLSKIYDEIESSHPYWERPENGDLTNWALQGVFLINTSLTRDPSLPQTSSDHHFNKKIWLPFIIATISYIKSKNKDVLFVTWGAKAQDTLKSCKFKKIEDDNLFSCAHPSPLGMNARAPFKGCNHFVLINERLKKLGWSEIDW